MPLAAGQTLSFYEILGPVGAGGMGEVYRARDTRIEGQVAGGAFLWRRASRQIRFPSPVSPS